MRSSLLFTFAVLFFLSCTSKNIERTLNDVESYIRERPDSALTVLDSIDRDLLKSRKLRSHHALLFAMALDKNYIDVSDDSLALVALNWYDRHGDRKYKARALYYLGLSYYYSQDYDRAILELTKAEKIAESSDSLYWGMINSLQGHTYSNTYNNVEELNCVQKAYEIYSAIKNERLMDVSLCRLACIYMNQGKYEQAEPIFRQLMEKDNASDWVLGNTLCSYAYLKVNQQDSEPEEIMLMYEKAFERFGYEYMTTKDWWAYALVLSQLGRQEDSQNLVVQLETVDTTSAPAYWKYRLSKNNGDKASALEYLEKSCELDNKVIARALSQSLSLTQRDFHEAQSDIAEYKLKIRVLIFHLVLTASLLFIFVFSAVIIVKRRKYKEEKENYMQYVDEITRQLNELRKKDIPSLKRKYLELYKSRFENIRDLCDNYLQFKGKDNAEKQMYSKVVSMVDELRAEMQERVRFEEMLDVDLNGVMTTIRRDVKMKETDYVIFRYLIIGFDATTISRLIDTSVNTIYIRKSRIKRYIEESDSVQKAALLEMMS